MLGLSLRSYPHTRSSHTTNQEIHLHIYSSSLPFSPRIRHTLETHTPPSTHHARRHKTTPHLLSVIIAQENKSLILLSGSSVDRLVDERELWADAPKLGLHAPQTLRVDDVGGADVDLLNGCRIKGVSAWVYMA